MASDAEMPAKLECSLHKTIKKVTEDIDSMKFNTAIAAMMGTLNTIYEVGSITKDELTVFVKLLSPFAPHVAEEINEALAIAQASSVANDKGGLDARVEAGGKNFSGGQRQRLTIARALVKKPEILILDDSASALDFATDASLRRALREMESETTVFVVSQRAASVMHADTIIVLDDGQVVGQGKHDELLDSCPVYREIFDSQFKKEDAR